MANTSNIICAHILKYCSDQLQFYNHASGSLRIIHVSTMRMISAISTCMGGTRVHVPESEKIISSLEGKSIYGMYRPNQGDNHLFL